MSDKIKKWLPGGKEEFRGDISEELRDHVEKLTEENIRSGMTPTDARRAAAVRFGNVGAISDAVQQERRVFRFEQLGADLRFGARMLRKNLGFTIVAVITLALGLGGTTAIFSVVNSVLLKPLAFHDPQRVVVLWETWKDRNGSVSAGNFTDWKEQSRTIDSMS